MIYLFQAATFTPAYPKTGGPSPEKHGYYPGREMRRRWRKVMMREVLMMRRRMRGMMWTYGG